MKKIYSLFKKENVYQPINSKTVEERIEYYDKNNKWKDAIHDEDEIIRLKAYAKYGWWDLAEHDKCANTRLIAFNHTKNWKGAQKDSESSIRFIGYHNSGTEWRNALFDNDKYIRGIAQIKVAESNTEKIKFN